MKQVAEQKDEKCESEKHRCRECFQKTRHFFVISPWVPRGKLRSRNKQIHYRAKPLERHGPFRRYFSKVQCF